jgi:hypothetical protein
MGRELLTMDVKEAAARFAELQVQRQKGLLSDQEYRSRIDQLRVQDSKGTWWQPAPDGTGWLFWDGAKWQPGALPPAGSPAPAVSGPQSGAAGTQDFSGFRAGIMDRGTYSRISQSVPWNKRPQSWWDRFSITLGIVVAVVWFVYASLTPVISLLTSGYMSEEFDLVSPLLMVAMPLVLIWKRKEIDNLLMPLQPTRHKVSRKLLIGIGIAVPFLTAFIIYHVFGISQYPLMYWNIVIGTLASYALVREPVLADRYRGNPQDMRMPDLRVPMLLLIGLSACVRVVMADHCLADPLNARDCMRTTGTAELLAGGVSAGVSGAVNGPTMVQTLSEGGESGGPGEGGTGDGGPLDNMDLCFDEGF